MTPTVATLDQDQQRRHNLRNTLHTWLLILGAGLLMAVIAWTVYGVGGIIWAAIFGYVLFMQRKQRRLQRQIDLLKESVDKSKNHA